jgi:hypothetical protein
MDTRLTREQALAAAANPDQPLVLVDPESNRKFVLLPADVYERLKALRGEDFEPRDAYQAVDRAFAEGWDDPRMADYDRYEEFRP